MFPSPDSQAVVATFHRFVELIETRDGVSPLGWPLSFRADFPRRPNHHHSPPASGGGGSGGGGGGAAPRERGATFHGSAALHDVDGDGREDVCVADGASGRVYFIAVGEVGEG